MDDALVYILFAAVGALLILNILFPESIVRAAAVHRGSTVTLEERLARIEATLKRPGVE
jgi:hypothetical protein